jgi:signal peptidase I
MGAESRQPKKDAKSIAKRNPLWYVLPLFLNVVGGVIAYFIIRKDDPQKARNCLLFGVLLFVIPFVMVLGIHIVFGTFHPFYVITSGSMRPTLNTSDVLVVQGNVPFQDLKIGDIIVFHRPSDHGRIITHRVVEILNDNPRIIKTKGDHNHRSIDGADFPITEQQYIGKVEYVIPQMGYVKQFLTPPVIYIIIVMTIGITMTPIILYHIRYRKKRMSPF